MHSDNLQRSMPIFDIGEYLIREQKEQDLPVFFSYYTNPEVHRHIFCHIPISVEDAKNDFDFWRKTFFRGDGAYFSIARKIDDQMIGSIGITNFNRSHKRIELSYDLSKDYWNKGIMTKAINKVCDYAFYNFGVNRIEAYVVPENFASRNLLIKSGFQIEGYLRQHRFYHEQFRDVIFLSLLRQDFYK